VSDPIKPGIHDMPEADYFAQGDIDFTTPAAMPEDPDEARDRLGWHMRMVRTAEDQQIEIQREFDREVNRITELTQNRLRIIKSRRAWHAAPIESYHRMALNEDPKRKTIETMHGRSKMTVAKKPRVFIDDPEAATAWAVANRPHIVKTSVNVTDLRNAVDVQTTKAGDIYVTAPDLDTGEIKPVPGVHAEIPRPTHTIDTDPGSPL